jgi:hypothetical protein
MATVHEAFIGLAQTDSVLALANLIRNDEACIAPGLQISGMIEGRCRAGRVAVPADAGVRGELVHLLSIGSPNVVHQNVVPSFNTVSGVILTSLALGYHSGHLLASMMWLQMRARSVDQQLVVREQIGL